MSGSLYVGVDVSRLTNVVCGVDDQGERVNKTASFPNTAPGAVQLESWIVEQMQKIDADHLLVGTEATSFYDFHLMEHQQFPFWFSV